MKKIQIAYGLIITGALTRTRTANLLITNQRVQTYLLKLSLILNDSRVLGQEDYLTDYILTTPCSMLVFCMFFVPSCSASQCLRKIIEPRVIWCPHTDSNREPTDYKSVVVSVSPQIIIDSK